MIEDHSPVVRDGSRLSRRSAGLLTTVFLAIALAAVLSLVRLPYVVMEPGPITDTLGKNAAGKQLITVSGAPTYPTTGSLDFTTVRVVGGPGSRVNVWEVARGWLDPHSAVVDEEQVFPHGVTQQQVEQENAAEMTGSQQEAIAVALRSTGRTVPERITVSSVPDGAPAKSVLKAGDEFVSIDGAAATNAESVRSAVQAHRPGENVALVLRRNGKQVEVSAPTTKNADGQAALGIFLGTAYDFPVKVTVDAGEVGGPSAGTMFALGIYDTLTPGPLTGGKNIAGTGTLDSTGKVGPIGGIQQKLAGARGGGASWFLAPAENCNEVVGHVPDGLKVVRIDTFASARTAVERIAAGTAAGLPTCTS